MISSSTEFATPPVFTDIVQDLLARNLWTPALELNHRPKKDIRSQLVLVGYELAHSLENLESSDNDSENLRDLMQVIEEIHMGSLIIDDIQDNSSERRGGPCIHNLYGMPLALNAGNWLYFKALQKIEHTSLEPHAQLNLYHWVHRIMSKAHLGQALDLGTNILEMDVQHIERICMQSLEYKSGCLVGLAMTMGALVANADPALQQEIFTMGQELGILLQIFDDLGNLNTNENNPKNLEDLYLKRPSFIWAYLFTHASLHERSQFLAAVADLPDKEALHSLLQTSQLKEKMQTKAKEHLQSFQASLRQTCGNQDMPPAIQRLLKIGEQLYGAYN